MSVIGVLLLLVAVLSFTRAVQRLFEQTWELAPLSVRNTLNGLRWVVALVAYVMAGGGIHAVVGRGRLELVAPLLVLPLTAVFLVWSGRIHSAKRIDWRDLLPFGVIAAILSAAYSVGASVYVPHLFSTYATRYGVIGAVFAMICVALVVVGSAALGREVDDELDRIRKGERAARSRRPPPMGERARRGAIPVGCRARADRPPSCTQDAVRLTRSSPPRVRADKDASTSIGGVRAPGLSRASRSATPSRPAAGARHDRRRACPPAACTDA